MSPEAELITGEELLAMGDIGPCELVDGRIVPKTPAGAEHGILEAAIGHRLSDFVAGRSWIIQPDTCSSRADSFRTRIPRMGGFDP